MDIQSVKYNYYWGQNYVQNDSINKLLVFSLLRSGKELNRFQESIPKFGNSVKV